VSSNEARVAGWGGQPAQWSASFGNDRGVASWPTPINLANDGAWCLPGAVPGVQLIVEPRLLLWTGGCGTGRADVDRLSALVGWHCGAATQCAGVDRCACIGPPPLQPPSAPFIEIMSVRPYLLRTGETGWRGGGRRTYRPVSRSQSRTSMKDACPWKLYTSPGMCGDVMYVCHSMRQTDHDNAQLAVVDIKALADINTASRCALPRPG